MEFVEALETLKSVIPEINHSKYDGIIVKRLKSSNTLDEGRSTNQTHIAITGEQMGIFPLIYGNQGYHDCSYEEKVDALKKYFLTLLRFNLYRSNVEKLCAFDKKEMFFFEEVEKTSVSVVKSRRDAQSEQIQLALSTYDDRLFTAFRNVLHANDWLVILKKEFEIEYDCFGVKSSEGESLENLNNKFFFKNTTTKIPAEKNLSIPSSEKETLLAFLPRQQIYYGAPGTGKSFEIDRLLKQFAKNDLGEENSVPANGVPANNVPASSSVPANDDSQNESDNDLPANFGQAVPAPAIVPAKSYSQRNHADKQENHTAFSFPQATKAAENLENKYSSKTNIFRTTFHPDSDYASFVGTFKPHTDGNGKITYAFVPQVFLKAYVTAVKNESVPVFLVIEEINRGNCAQIFGDLFQLLDRNKEGESEYSIDPDQDIREFLAQNGVPADKLKLPRNLYIWATMNTSDQSLFPIDSAFKRRWEWKYVPIKNHPDENWKIDVARPPVDWWKFLEKINEVIEKITELEDKKLGYFFVKANDDKLISAGTFVSKVLFYLWEDVFKNYGFDDKIFEDSAGTRLAFRNFFKENGDVDEKAVANFLKKVVPDEFGNGNPVPAESQNSVPAESQNSVPASE